MKIIYPIVYGLFFLLSMLPFRVLYCISDFFYLLVYRLIGYRKKVVRNNLTSSFPEKSLDSLSPILTFRDTILSLSSSITGFSPSASAIFL